MVLMCILSVAHPSSCSMSPANISSVLGLMTDELKSRVRAPGASGYASTLDATALVSHMGWLVVAATNAQPSMLVGTVGARR